MMLHSPFFNQAALRFGRCLSLLVASACLVTSTLNLQSPADGQDLTWDNGAANLLWDTTSSNWTGSTWTNGRGAIFNNFFASGNISVGSGISAHSLSFSSSNYTLSGSNPLTLAAGTGTLPAGTINVDTGVVATLDTNLVSNIGFLKSGAGELVLNGTANSFTGSIPITGNGNLTSNILIGPPTSTGAGMLTLGNANALATTTNVGIGNGYLNIGNHNVTINDLVFNNSNLNNWNATLNAKNGVVGSGTLTVNGEIRVMGVTGGNGGNSIAANFDLGGKNQIIRTGVTSSFGLFSSLMFTGNIGGTGSLTKTFDYGQAGVFGSTDGIGLFGNNTYTGATVLNGGSNAVTGTNASTSLRMYGLAGAGNGSSVSLQGANGSFLGATLIQAQAGGTLIIDNTAAVGTPTGTSLPYVAPAQNNDRIADNVTIELQDGQMAYRALNDTAGSETFGNMNITAGHNTIVLSPNSTITSPATVGSVALTGNNLTIGSRTTLMIGTSAANVGSTAVPPTNNGTIRGATLGGNATLKFIGTVPSGDATGIIRGVVTGHSTFAGSLSPAPQDFVIYDPTDGVKALATYATDFTTAGTNVNVSAASTLASSQSINALKATTAAAFTTTINAGQTMAIDSGMMLSTSATHTISGGTIAFGNQPGRIFGSHTINSAVTGTDGLIHATGTLTLAGDLSGLSGRIDNTGNNVTTNLNTNTFAGELLVRRGILQINTNQIGASLGAIRLGIPTSDVDLLGSVPTLSFNGTGASFVSQIDRDIIIDNGMKTIKGLQPSFSMLTKFTPVSNTSTTPANQTFTGDILLNTDVNLQGGGATPPTNVNNIYATIFQGAISGAGRFVTPNGRVIFDTASVLSNAGGLDMGNSGFTSQVTLQGTATGNADIVIRGANNTYLRYAGASSLYSGQIKVLDNAAIIPLNSSVINNQISIGNPAFPGATVLNANVGPGVVAEWAGAITGTGGLTKGVLTGGPAAAPFNGFIFGTNTGTGTLVLTSNSNTYSGTTTINTGTLQIGNGGSTGVLGTGGVTNNAALVFNRSNNFSVANLIGGTGTVTKTGAGNLILAANNTYSGTTTVTQGKLIVNGTHTNGSSYTVGANAALGGTGRIANSDVNILAKGFLTPGNDVGTLRLDQSLNMGGTYEWQIRSPELADVVTVGANLLITGQLSISLLPDFDLEKFDKFTLFAYQGTFTGGFINSLDGWRLNYADKLPGLNTISQSGSWKYVTLTALEGRPQLLSRGVAGYKNPISGVPEPSSIGLVCVSLILLSGKRSKKRA